MIYVGAVLISLGRYDFAKMIQVFTLIIFSITFSASVMTYRALSVLQRTRSDPELIHVLASACDDQVYPRLYRSLSTAGPRLRDGRKRRPHDVPHQRQHLVR